MIEKQRRRPEMLGRSEDRLAGVDKSRDDDSQQAQQQHLQFGGFRRRYQHSHQPQDRQHDGGEDLQRQQYAREARLVFFLPDHHPGAIAREAEIAQR